MAFNLAVNSAPGCSPSTGDVESIQLWRNLILVGVHDLLAGCLVRRIDQFFDQGNSGGAAEASWMTRSTFCQAPIFSDLSCFAQLNATLTS
jgi:hypothetical protein